MERGWVSHAVILSEIGLSHGQLRGMAQRGIIARGVHVAVVDRKRLYHLERLQQWLDMQACAQREQESRSDTRCGGDGSRTTSQSNQQMRRYRMQLEPDAA